MTYVNNKENLENFYFHSMDSRQLFLLTVCTFYLIIIGMRKVQPFNQQTKSEFVESQLEKLILSSQYKEGDRLPSQSELSNQFNVGTRIIREVLKHLEAKGLVSLEQGRGVFVRKQRLDFYLKSLTASISNELPQNKKVLIDLTKARELWEIYALEQFMENPDSEFLEKMNGLVNKMEILSREKDMAEYRALDIEFHRSLVSVLHNDVIDYMYKHLTNLLMYSIINTEQKNNYTGLTDHKEVLQFLTEGNVEGAVKTIRGHFAKTVQTIQSLDTIQD